MKSTRRSRYWGHLGTGLTFAVPFGLIGFGWALLGGQFLVGTMWLVAMIANRWILAAAVMWALGSPILDRSTLKYPLRDLLGGVLWVASYCGSTMRYHGGVYTLEADGRFRPKEQTNPLSR